MLTNAYYGQTQLLIRVCVTEVVAFLHKSADCQLENIKKDKGITLQGKT
jgi:hypothetical protein